MEFIKLPKPIDITGRELQEQVADWMNQGSVQNMNNSFDWKIWVDMLLSQGTEWSKSGMPYLCTFRNFTHHA